MTETPVLRPMRVFAMASFATALFACMNVFVKLALETHAIAEVMFFRNALAIVPVLFLIHRHKDGYSLLKTDRPMGHLGRGVIGVCSMIFFFWSFSLLPLANATALHFATPLLLTALSVPFLGEKVGPWRWGAVVVGLIGVIVVANPTGHASATAHLGTIVALTAATSSAFAMLMIRRLGGTEHALTIVFYFSLCGTVLSGLAMPFFWTTPTPQSLIYLVMTGLMGGAAQLFLTKSYAEAPAAYVSPFSYLAIVFAAFFGWAIWDHVPTTNVIIGATIVVASGLFILYRETVRKVTLVRPNIYLLQPVSPTEKDNTEAAEDAAEALQTKIKQAYDEAETNRKTGTDR